jgi:hypothetical protein
MPILEDLLENVVNHQALGLDMYIPTSFRASKIPLTLVAFRWHFHADTRK